MENIEEIWKEAPHTSWLKLTGPGCWYEDRHGRLYWREGIPSQGHEALESNPSQGHEALESNASRGHGALESNPSQGHEALKVLWQ